MFAATLANVSGSGRDNLPFPYNDNAFYRANMHRFWERIVSVNGEETLVIPALRESSDIAQFNKPEAWLIEQIQKYSLPPE